MANSREPTSNLLEGARNYLSLTRAYCEEVAQLTEWDGSQPLELVARAAYVRQYEALESMVSLADSTLAATSAQLLRPACEEMIVLEYVAQIPRESANRLISILGLLEVGDDLRAQRARVGDDAIMLSIGFSAAYLDSMERHAVQARANLRAVAEELAWSDRRPRLNVRMLAELTGRLDLHDFLYHATSRFVHFKVKELMRRGWGRDGTYTISSAHFERHWLDFSLYWGIFIHAETAATMVKLVPGLSKAESELDGEALLQAVKSLGGPVPLVTPDELRVDGAPEPWVP